MARKFPSREAIELSRRDLERRGYLKRAEQAGLKLTPREIRIAKSIRNGGTVAAELPEKVRLLFEKICKICGARTAIDLFQRTIDDCRKSGTAKKQGPHNSDRDALLLAIFNEKDPYSPISRALKGDLPKGGDKFYEPMTKTEFATIVGARRPVGKQKKPMSAEQVLRRLKYLRSQRAK